MLCVEVSVNGMRHCLAAPVDTLGFSAFVWHPAKYGGTTSTLRVSAMSPDLTLDYQWGDDRILAAGDVVTIRVVDAKAADVPVASPSAIPAVLRDRRRLPDMSRLLSGSLEKSDRGRAMLTWLVLLYIAALLQHCAR